MRIEGFITNLGKYNEGTLMGEWVAFPISEDDLKDVFIKIGIDGVKYEEYFFTGWDFSDDCPNLGLGQLSRIDHVNELVEKIDSITFDNEKKFLAMVEAYSLKEALDCDYDTVCLYDNINDEQELGEYYIHETDEYDLSAMGTLANYIDYAALGHDRSVESNGAFTSYGWLERD